VAKASSRFAYVLAGIFITLLVLVILVALGVLPVKSEQSTADAGAETSLTPLQIFQKDAPGVVEVRARFLSPGSSSSAGQGLGSGFLVSTDGYIITNAHVITNDGVAADSVEVVFRSENGASASTSRVPASVVGGDESTDVAVLKIDPSKAPALHPLTLGDSAGVRVGEPVVAIGNPLGLSFTLTSGIVSATNRNLQAPDGSVIPDGIQTDAAINSGNSGGPLIDMSGKVIGVNTQIITQSGGSQGLGFAVPIATAVDVMDQLKTSGTVAHAYLGVSGQTLSADLADALGMSASQGVLVMAVSPGSPAAQAGIAGGHQHIMLQGQPFLTGGDVIEAIDGKAIMSSQDLAATVARHKPSDTITLTVLRGGQQQELKATLAVRPTGA
jgi:S1-C subfamily serine protease